MYFSNHIQLQSHTLTYITNRKLWVKHNYTTIVHCNIAILDISLLYFDKNVQKHSIVCETVFSPEMPLPLLYVFLSLFLSLSQSQSLVQERQRYV